MGPRGLSFCVRRGKFWGLFFVREGEGGWRYSPNPGESGGELEGGGSLVKDCGDRERGNDG
jgi:hypothetical protein